MEMHILAYSYHWSRDSVWDLPTRERREWVGFIQKQNEYETEEVQSISA